MNEPGGSHKRVFSVAVPAICSRNPVQGAYHPYGLNHPCYIVYTLDTVQLVFSIDTGTQSVISTPILPVEGRYDVSVTRYNEFAIHFCMA